MHSGHRKRLRARFIKDGIDNVSPHEVLEYLLTLSIPRKNTNEIAHRLIEKFGSFSGVLDAPRQAIEKIEGIGENSSYFLTLLPDLFRYYNVDKNNENKQLKLTFDGTVDLIRAKFIGKKKECIVAIFMDAQRRLKYCGFISEGCFDNVDVNLSLLIDRVKEYNTRYVILAHNHPSGIALPSRTDIDVTAKIKETLGLIEIILVDHFIVSNDDVTSMALLDLKESKLKNFW